MRRPLAPEDVKLWSMVTATVRPSAGRRGLEGANIVTATTSAEPVSQPFQNQNSPPKETRSGLKAPAIPLASAALKAPEDIEPRRRRRISQARERIGARLDLHGMDQVRAQLAVMDFVQRAHDSGMRAVLIITGKGTWGDGILRRRAPDWLSDPRIRPLVAGFSFADRHHGGDGALYVALKKGGR